MLTLGGMAAGALASLSVYMPAYYAYLLPIFLPVIIYNFYSLEWERLILGIMFILFVIMLIVTAKNTAELLQETISLTIEKDDLILRLKNSHQKQQKALEAIKRLSITDSLTGLYNRRYFEIKLKDESYRAKRNKHSLNLVFIDIDNFKIVNDSLGHPSGDSFLKHLACIIKQSTQRENDAAFRIGGDEFAAIFTDASLDETIKICSALKEHFNKNSQLDVTISIGILCIPPSSSEDIENIVSAADKTLYRAKKEGKNKIISERLE
ncbi:GGDEF domain-containing protein [Legionella cardiaca]|uniref:diguanylate cyclase n=1 Tax=Legionella cardiaca TaxID=1071983 RepID=A0ABY8AUM2_9GAMM|nr:GGDEF domain-containing protein [Legionella cardiaca]WED44374.1 GGDEF domain-containing protein [Legionella cardiaca]